MSVVESVRQAALALVEGRAAGGLIARAVVGGIYAAVQLEGGEAGVAFRFPEGEGCHRGGQAGGREGADPQAAAWAGRPAGELIRRLGSPNLVESALALAAINAACNRGGAGDDAAAGDPGVGDRPARPPGAALPGDVLDHLVIRPGDRLCMVGCFLPVLERLAGREVEVVSVDERPRPGALPAQEVETVLPSSQLALITATSLVNGTLDRLLELARSCRSVALLGPSTPMLSAAFAGTPVGLLSGIRVIHPDPVLEIVASGGGFRDFRPHVRKLNLQL